MVKSRLSDVPTARIYQTNIRVLAANLQDRDILAEVIVTFRIMPEGVEVDLDKLEDKIKAIVKPERISREPIAFGIVALNATKLIPEASGEMDEMENKIKSIEGVGGVEITEVSRSL